MELFVLVRIAARPVPLVARIIGVALLLPGLFLLLVAAVHFSLMRIVLLIHMAALRDCFCGMARSKGERGYCDQGG